MLTRDDLGFFLLIKFFLSHPLTLGWLEIEFHDFFLLAFYGVIIIP